MSNACHWPPIPLTTSQERETMRNIRAIVADGYCGKLNRDHPCAGRVTMDHRTITMQCPLCGDERRTFFEETTGKTPLPENIVARTWSQRFQRLIRHLRSCFGILRGEF